jgi:hypothetical protein
MVYRTLFKTALFLLLLVFSKALYGQTLVIDNSKWNTLRELVKANGSEKWTETVNIRQDTSINGQTYKRVFQKDNHLGEQETMIAFIREDSTGKVFIKPIDKNVYLLYDFGLKTGDTVVVFDWVVLSNTEKEHSDMAKINYRVDSIVPVFIGGASRKLYYLASKDGAYWDNYQQWISGIGGIHGILYSGELPVSGHPLKNLLCYSQNDSLIYINPTYNSCSINTLSSINALNINELMYFNRSSKTLIIKLIQAGSAFIKIYELSGNMAFSQLVKVGENKIMLDFLPSGIYIVSLSINNNSIQYKLNIN